MVRSVVILSLFGVGCAAEGSPELLDASADAELRAAATAWVGEQASFDGLGELAVVESHSDDLSTGHVRLQQHVDGVPVLVGQLVVHLDGSNEVTHTTDALLDVDVDTVPTIAADLAEQLAVGEGTGVVSDTELVVWRQDGVDHLVWKVQVEDLDQETPSRPIVLVDAHDGSVVTSWDNLQSLRNRMTYDANNTWYAPGTLVRSEGTPRVNDPVIDRIHLHSGATYEYYSREQGRDSWDGAGAAMAAVGHYGGALDNAYWDGSQTVYGDGAFYFKPMGNSIEIVGHEFTHGVTERTAGLIYFGESGGLNEGTSDIIGAVIESWSQGWTVNQNTWLIGEDIMKPGRGAALRSMSNPPADGMSIDNYADFYSYIDVHYSSGIANKAFYLMSSDPSLGIESAADVWYRALVTYMTPGTTFHQARLATVQAATDLFGAGSAQVTAVGASWSAVGVF